MRFGVQDSSPEPLYQIRMYTTIYLCSANAAGNMRFQNAVELHATTGQEQGKQPYEARAGA